MGPFSVIVGILILLIFGSIFSDRGKGGFGSFFRSFFIGFLIGRFWKVFLVIILVVAVLLGISYVAYSFEMDRDHILDVLEMDILPIVIPIVASLALGVVFGLIPFFTGRYCSMPDLGSQGLKWCILTGIILPVSFVIAIVYTVIIVSRYSPGEEGVTPSFPAPYPAVRCLTGPSAGRIYEITEAGVTMGRNPLCTIVCPSGNTVVSRYHCTVYRHEGMLVLTDAGSMNGTFT